MKEMQREGCTDQMQEIQGRACVQELSSNHSITAHMTHTTEEPFYQNYRECKWRMCPETWFELLLIQNCKH